MQQTLYNAKFSASLLSRLLQKQNMETKVQTKDNQNNKIRQTKNSPSLLISCLARKLAFRFTFSFAFNPRDLYTGGYKK